MKGIVFTEFIEMVEQQFSPFVANRLLDESELASGGAYTSVGTYDYRELITLVNKLSEISGLTTSVLIKTYGNYLFGRFLDIYPSFFNRITSAQEFIASVDDIVHLEVLKLYPDAELPHFHIVYTGSTHWS
jgi:hypothetical protein